jgi:hypothetical protein
VASDHKIAFEKNDTWEGPVLPLGFKKRPHTLYFTSLRDPVSRVQSSYIYEGRWNMQDGNRTAGNGVPFDAYLEKNRCHPTAKQIWQCSSNCFTKWLSGVLDAPTCTSTSGSALPEHALRTALQHLMQFDQVVCESSLADPQYRRYLERRLNTTRPYSSRNAPLSEYAYLWEARLPPEYTPEAMKELQRLNRMDCSLIRSASAVLCPRPVHAPPDHDFGKYRGMVDAIKSIHNKYGEYGPPVVVGPPIPPSRRPQHGPATAENRNPSAVTAAELESLTAMYRERARKEAAGSGPGISRHHLCDAGSVGYRSI